MKLLLFADLHGSLEALKEIKDKSGEADAILCAGDISMFQDRLDFLLSELNKTKKPVMIIPGNHETDEDLQKAANKFDNIISLHNNFYELGDFLFLGYGGGGFSTNYPVFEGKLNKFINLISKHEKVILVTHAPPYKTKLDLLMDRHVGSIPLRTLIEKTQPKLLVCGHIHENKGIKDNLGKTKIINPGYKGMIIDL